MNHKVAHVDSNQYRMALQSTQVPLLVKMSTKWCPPCRAMEPVTESIAQELDGKLQIIEVDGDDSPEIAEELRITGYPTMVLFKNGTEVERILGSMSRASLKKRLEPHL